MDLVSADKFLAGRGLCDTDVAGVGHGRSAPPKQEARLFSWLARVAQDAKQVTRMLKRRGMDAPALLY